MVQFNLLPDVKLEYVKAQRTKRLLTSVSVIVSVAALFVLFLSFVSVDVVQKKSLHDLDNDIQKYSSQLKSVKDLSQILTVQNQLSTLTGLHDKEPVASRLFKYVSQTTPSGASLTSLSVDFTGNSLSFGGQAPSLDTVSAYTDTLKATKFSVAGTNGSKPAFSKVVLSSFSRNDKNASFTITCTFDPAIFDSKQDVSLIVPNNSEAADQSNIFGAGQ